MFSDILKELRDDHHDTQASFAAKMEVATSTVSNWEQNKSEPSFAQLCKICDLYGVSADYLLGRRVDDPQLKKKRFEALSQENQRLIRKLESFLIYDQKKESNK